MTDISLLLLHSNILSYLILWKREISFGLFKNVTNKMCLHNIYIHVCVRVCVCVCVFVKNRIWYLITDNDWYVIKPYPINELQTLDAQKKPIRENMMHKIHKEFGIQTNYLI